MESVALSSRMPLAFFPCAGWPAKLTWLPLTVTFEEFFTTTPSAVVLVTSKPWTVT